MKKLTICAALAMVAMLVISCGKDDYKSFVGTWGIEKVEYYNTDFAGNPITASMKTYTYDPNSTDNGIQLYFNEDKSGKLRDSALDTINTDWNPATQQYESYIVNPDTVIVYKFTYSYDKSEKALYMNMDYVHTFKMDIVELSKDAFVYESEYDENYIEKAYLKRISNTSSKSESRKKIAHPHQPGSFLGDR